MHGHLELQCMDIMVYLSDESSYHVNKTCSSDSEFVKLYNLLSICVQLHIHNMSRLNGRLVYPTTIITLNCLTYNSVPFHHERGYSLNLMPDMSEVSAFTSVIRLFRWKSKTSKLYQNS